MIFQMKGQKRLGFLYKCSAIHVRKKVLYIKQEKLSTENIHSIVNNPVICKNIGESVSWLDINGLCRPLSVRTIIVYLYHLLWLPTTKQNTDCQMN